MQHGWNVKRKHELFIFATLMNVKKLFFSSSPPIIHNLHGCCNANLAAGARSGWKTGHVPSVLAGGAEVKVSSALAVFMQPWRTPANMTNVYA